MKIPFLHPSSVHRILFNPPVKSSGHLYIAVVVLNYKSMLRGEQHALWTPREARATSLLPNPVPSWTRDLKVVLLQTPAVRFSLVGDSAYLRHRHEPERGGR